MKSAGEGVFQAAERTGADAAAIEKIRLMYRPVNCYRLRHSYAVRLLLASGNKDIVQKALGHANIETTNFYTQMVTRPALGGGGPHVRSGDSLPPELLLSHISGGGSST
jgi:integrase